ncbi:hypothetical protein CKF53_09395 [Corynebacterium striatum]|nr:hypothetical protein CKF53_09395 [Corynebacterium striatum]
MRNYAQIQLAIWNNDDFRALTANAQHLYFMLISHPSLMQCGVGDWRPARLACFVSDWSRADVEHAAGELVERLFVLVDLETEEFLVRSYIRNDGFMKQPNMGVALARSLAEVGSEVLRGVVVHELNRLHKDCPELKGFSPREVQEVLRKGSIDPSGNPLGNPFGNPSGKGSGNPSDHPSTDPSGKGSRNPSGNPSPTPVPTPNTFPVGGRRKGKGGSGGKGETTAGSAAPDETEPTPTPQSLDELAAAHAASQPDPTRCPEHQHLAPEAVPNCWQCAQARKQHEASKADEERQAANARRAAIDACTQCDDLGYVKVANGTVAKCTHQPMKGPF